MKRCLHALTSVSVLRRPMEGIRDLAMLTCKEKHLKIKNTQFYYRGLTENTDSHCDTNNYA